MSARKIIHTYLTELRKVAEAPHTTEHSYRAILKTLMQDIAQHLDRPLARITIEPGHITEAGAPDLILYGATDQNLIGYVETKDLGKDLDHLGGHDARQFCRYRAAFPAWIFTNYVDFRLYEDGQLTHHVNVCHQQQITGDINLNHIARQKADELSSLFDRFLQLSTPNLADAQSLARLLAHKARLLESILVKMLIDEAPDDQLISQLEAYRRWLIPDLTPERFADFYAQTLTYGLFFAAYENSQRTPLQPFNRSNLLNLLPDTIRPIRAIFQMLAAHLLPAELDWIVDDLVRLLEQADLGAISTQLGKSRDPVVHFYETFLSQYDPDLREKRGVYYTPDEVVSYIVASLDQLLRKHFDKADGLASPDVTLLDPALGTGTFFAHALRQVADNFGPAHAGDLPDHLRRHTLKNWHGFELLAAPYVLAYLKLGRVLEELNVSDVTPQVYLTNTLTEHTFPQTLPGPFERAVSEDGKAAQRVKGQEKILVVLGNPPYSGTSYNTYDKVDDYRVMSERARNWLQDDYIKFIRWAEWKIAEAEQSGYQHGVIGFITSHVYLNGLIHRGMREHLLNHFSHIYILNLHGNSRIREPLPPGVERDENVFDIQQGVAIGLFVREAEHQERGSVFYADVWGKRQQKYEYLASYDVTQTDWEQLNPTQPFYFFIQRDLPDLADAYRAWPSVKRLMPLHSQAIVSARDAFVYDFDRQTLIDRMSDFAIAQGDENAIDRKFGVHNTREFEIAEAQRALSKNFSEPEEKENIIRALYRPFDWRWLYYSDDVIEWPRKNVLGHLLKPDNIALVTFRHTRRPTQMRALAARHVVDARLLSSESNCYAFPLYRYNHHPDANGQVGLNMNGTGREPNIDAQLLLTLSQVYETDITPEEIFHYIYGVLNTPGYQDEFEELLMVDFPRIPFTADYDVFHQVAKQGQRFVALHLLEAPDLRGVTNLAVGYPLNGDNKIERGYPNYNPTEERVHINPTQYFQGITPAMWAYHVGGYNPLEKWLKDRCSHTLNVDERRHYETFATAIAKILEQQPQLEKTWQLVRHGHWVNPFHFDKEKSRSGR
jgi:predicted helicase